MDSYKDMQPEFTAEMHYDLLSGECSHLEVMIMAAFCEIEKGVPVQKACEKHGITIEQFKDNYSKVFPGSSYERDSEIFDFK